MFESQHTAYAAWSLIAQDKDHAAAAFVRALGAETALEAVEGRVDVYGLDLEAFETSPHRTGATLEDLLERWQAAHPGRAMAEEKLNAIAKLGGGLLTPEDEHWPEGATDPGLTTLALWWRGNLAQGLPKMNRSIAIVGSRDATEYGRSITAEISAHAVGQGFTVFSGGAYGIDARAHEAALCEETNLMPTVALQAGGLDRLYPAGNHDLLERVAESGLLLSAVAPGAAPTRSRFLARNGLLASLVGAVVVTEARWRSGAMTTARHASENGKPVGAVPGSVYSANSAGTHRLIREGVATMVTDGHEVLELLPNKA